MKPTEFMYVAYFKVSYTLCFDLSRSHIASLTNKFILNKNALENILMIEK